MSVEVYPTTTTSTTNDNNSNNVESTLNMNNAEIEVDTDDIMSGLEHELEGLDITSQGDEVLEQAAEYMERHLDDELVQQAVTQGKDLREYASQIRVDLRVEETLALEQYAREAQKMAHLYSQITSCDGILRSMEQMLSCFQANLSNISSEIDYLQEASTTMSQKLKNRQEVSKDLQNIVEQLVVPELMIRTILETPVQENAFSEQLQELSQKLNFLKELDFLGAIAVDDVREVIEKLRHKSIFKIKDFIFEKIYQFRKPMTNYQVPQNAMIKFKYFNQFLMAHSRDTALQVRHEYINTVGKVYFSYFKEYHSKIIKLEYEERVTKDDMMGFEETGNKRGIALFSTNKNSLTNKSTIFTLNRRDEILTTRFEDPMIIPHTSKADKYFTYEALFRSTHFCLTDTCSREYIFLQEFFSLDKGTQELFESLFDKTLNFLYTSIESSISNSFDSIGVLLSVHIIYRLTDMMNKRSVPALNAYWKKLLALLWPRYLQIIDMNIASMKLADSHRLSHFDTRSHYVTRRYAEFSAGIVSINRFHPDDRVNQSLSLLQTEVEGFIMRLAGEFVTRKDQLVFLINNYNMMLAVLAERETGEGHVSHDIDSFQALLDKNKKEFVELTLENAFNDLIQFVKRTEVTIEGNKLNEMTLSEDEIKRIARDFAHNWKKTVDDISQDVLKLFSSFREGGAIYQDILTQMLQYYHRYHKIMTSAPFRNMPVKRELLSIHQLMVEVKKLKPHFVS